MKTKQAIFTLIRWYTIFLGLLMSWVWTYGQQQQLKDWKQCVEKGYNDTDMAYCDFKHGVYHYIPEQFHDEFLLRHPQFDTVIFINKNDTIIYFDN